MASTSPDEIIRSASNTLNLSHGELQNSDILPDFLTVAGPPHLSLAQNGGAAHVMHALPPLFPTKSEVATLMPASMHVPLTNPALPTDVSLPDMLNPSPVRAPPPGFLSEFPPSGDPLVMQGLLNNHIPIASPSIASSSQHPPSLLPSPVNLTTFKTPSSLASAFDTMSARHNVPQSFFSNGPSGSGSGQALSSNNSSLSPESHLPVFGGPVGVDMVPGDGVAGDSTLPHHVVVAQMFSKMNKISRSVLESCTKGAPNEAIPKITELINQLRLTGSLVLEPTAFAGASPPLDQVPLSPVKASSASPPLLPPVAASSGTLPSAPGPSLIPVSHQSPITDLNATLEVAGSRKRCASSVPTADDRMNKAMKMEPDDGLLVDMSQIAPPEVLPLPPVDMFSAVPIPSSGMVGVQSTSTFPFGSPAAPSRPPTRPPSPATLAALQSFPMNTVQPLPSNPVVPFSHLVSVSAPATQAKFEPVPTPPVAGAVPFPANPGSRSSWSEVPNAPPQRQLQHSYSAGQLPIHQGLGIPPAASVPFPPPANMYGSPSTSPKAGPLICAPLGRVSRSGSVSTNPFAFGFSDPPMENYDFQPQAHPSSNAMAENDRDRGRSDDSDDEEYDDDYISMGRRRARTQSRPTTGHGSSPEGGTHSSSTHANDIPQEYRADVDRIFFEYLNMICSNLEATDAKGEPIHQTLMAKKMQRFDESTDFRPFKFRIAAFTHGFLEELAQRGFPEDKIPMKKIRNYLWSQPHIVRYNEDGKKVKSKGNHTWNMDAKKLPNGIWTFRQFHRQLAGAPPAVAYVGLPWTWTPRIWHPQGQLPGKDPSTHVQYNSLSLPSWLSWKDDVLCGTPPPDAESCDVLVEAKITQDDQEETLTRDIHITVAPTTLDPTSRRPSLPNEVSHPRRIASDSSLPIATPPRSSIRTMPQSHQDAQVVQVLTAAAQRVAQVAQSQVISAPACEPPGLELQALAKQQHVLTVTAQALDRGGLAGELPNGPTTSSNMSLAAAAQHVVLSAARHVVADHSAAQVAVGIPPSPASSAAAAKVTVEEVSAATQSAVAKAVELAGPLSSEVQVLMTASSLLQYQWSPLEPPQMPSPPESRRLQQTNPIPSRSASTSVVAFPPI